MHPTLPPKKKKKSWLRGLWVYIHLWWNFHEDPISLSRQTRQMVGKCPLSLSMLMNPSRNSWSQSERQTTSRILSVLHVRRYISGGKIFVKIRLVCYVKLLSDRQTHSQTNRQTNKRLVRHNLLGGSITGYCTIYGDHRSRDCGLTIYGQCWGHHRSRIRYLSQKNREF